MPADVVIRGGTVFDGTGAPGRPADVAIEGGVIAEIGPKLSGARDLDASGCAVAPGFIDIHTHYDAQVFWDPALRPSSSHGVTTVVAGNCGFTIAPTRPEHREVIARTLENVEDMDGASLIAGIPWEFETYPEYRAAIRRRGTVLNFTSYVGHTALRLYAMGDAAYERAATGEEIERMGRLVREAIDAGAAGFSTSFAYTHRGIDGKPVPSRFAARDEVEGLLFAAGRAGKGVVLVAVPGQQCGYADLYDLQPRVGRPFSYPLFAMPGGRHLMQLRMHQDALARGVQVWPQVTPRPLTMQFTLEDAYSLNVGKVFGDLMRHGREARIAAYRDPAWRARAAEDLERAEMKPRWDTFEVSESRLFPELEGRRVVELARERGARPLDVMCEIALAEDLATRFRAYLANDDVEAVGRLLAHEQVALGLSDAGAHVAQLCDAPLFTDLLAHWVRERGLMPLERAVRKMSGEPADLFGFVRRGYLREGCWADVCVFEPDTVGPGPLRRVRDFPAGAERLTAEEPTGVRHVLVNGTPIRSDGRSRMDELERRPGMWPEIA
ncbi:MAG TPA: amidohydrolase family protein [Candidatus Binatia bacterium]|nr:amidohydrolase family protein [Candidatus Binatia bacterium]